MTAEDDGVWNLEHKLVSDLLDRIESAERALLKHLNCPVDLPTIHAILAGEQSAPWPRRTAERDKERAWCAMICMAQTKAARDYIAGPNENARKAAYAAAIAALYAADNFTNAKLSPLNRPSAKDDGKLGGKKSGVVRAKKAAKIDVKENLPQTLANWERDETELRLLYRSPVPLVKQKSRRSERQIRRRIKKNAR